MISDSKRQKIPTPLLHIVATPIGNMGDLSTRAKETLSRVSVVFCEDTRRGKQLLDMIGSRARPLRLDAHASESEIHKAIQTLRDEGECALITDAGTPGIQDPGSALARACLGQGIRVSPLPGPSAVAAFLSVAGFRWGEFEFRGFFPRDRHEAEWNSIREISIRPDGCRVFVWFESPRRMKDTLQSGELALPEDQFRSYWVVAKEITKTHELVIAGNLSDIRSHLAASPDRDLEGTGEWVFGVEVERIAKVEAESSEWHKTLECLIECGVSPSDAAKKISQCFGVSRKQVYSRAIDLKDGKKLS